MKQEDKREKYKTNSIKVIVLERIPIQPARLAQLGERRSAEREAAGSSPGRTNTQGL